MDKIINSLAEKQSNRCTLYTNLQKNNGWSEAYTDVPGDQAYLDGYRNGFLCGYSKVLEEIEMYLSSQKGKK